jgi:MerR family mercuric resistance operon transcriptional regulator
MQGLKVGEVARRAGVNLQTIRYYERRGLLLKPPRTGSNHRVYPEDAVRRVRFVKRAQELGFSLKEVKELLSLRATPRAKCGDVLQRAEGKIRDIDDKIATLRGMRKALLELMEECEGNLPVTQCRILEALAKKEEKT